VVGHDVHTKFQENVLLDLKVVSGRHTHTDRKMDRLMMIAQAYLALFLGK
jgi:hypothetical protein